MVEPHRPAGRPTTRGGAVSDESDVLADGRGRETSHCFQPVATHEAPDFLSFDTPNHTHRQAAKLASQLGRWGLRLGACRLRPVRRMALPCPAVGLGVGPAPDVRGVERAGPAFREVTLVRLDPVAPRATTWPSGTRMSKAAAEGGRLGGRYGSVSGFPLSISVRLPARYGSRSPLTARTRPPRRAERLPARWITGRHRRGPLRALRSGAGMLVHGTHRVVQRPRLC